MAAYLVTLNFVRGTTVAVAAREAHRVAALLGRGVGFDFNGVALTAGPASDWRGTVAAYHKHWLSQRMRGLDFEPAQAGGVKL